MFVRGQRSAGIPACGFGEHPCARFRLKHRLGRDAQATRTLGSMRYAALKNLSRGRGRLTTFPDMVHVGIGYDVHALVTGRRLVLGGVEIPHTKGLDGHSDADALLHAITDAVLGAIGEVDIGHFFPNTDPRWRGVASRIFLEEAAKQVKARGGRIVNIDASLMAEAPKIYPHIQQMKANIASALGVDPKKVGVKATTNERMGFIGREEGIAAMAVASVDLPE